MAIVHFGAIDMHASGPVIVMELPEQLNRAQVRILLRELQPLLEANRPRMVLECSQVRHIDITGVEMLLYCMHEAMKLDGDLKLAAVSPAAESILQEMQVEHLFEIFATDMEAVQSFRALQPFAIPQRAPHFTNVHGALEDRQAA